MTPDGVAALLRALALASLFQAAGGALFIGYCGERLGLAARPARSLVVGAAIAAILFLAAHACVETARLSGDFAGAWDLNLQTVFWTSRGGIVHAVQIGALASIAVCVQGRSRVRRALSLAGAIMAIVALAGSGHTSIHPLRAALAPLLVIHVTLGACWFGSLGPLLLLLRRETPPRTTRELLRFSAIAGFAVPLLGVVGVAMAVVLVHRLQDLVQPYGLMLTTKAVLFALLLIVAAYNRWRHVPALMAGSPTAATALRRSIGWEIALIAAVFAVTAVMTTYFSP